MTQQTAQPPGAGGAAPGPRRRIAAEQYGIDIIPDSDRRIRPADLMWMWAGGLINVETVAFGALVASIGLDFVQCVIVIVIANLSWVTAAWASLAGNAAGTTAFTVSRAPFGLRGGRVVAFLNWVSQVTFEITGLYLAVLAGLALLHRSGLAGSAGVKIGTILGVAVLQFVLPRLGHGFIIKSMKWLVLPCLVLFAVLTVLTGAKMRLHSGTPASLPIVILGLAVAFSESGISWMTNAPDYSRYLPRETPARRHVLAVTLGAGIPMTLLMILGAAVATISPDSGDPIGGLPAVFPGWFVAPYLVFAIVQLIAINGLDLYSSGVTLQALGVRVSRGQAVAIDTVLCGAVTAIALFSSTFYAFVTDMVLFVMVWLAPWGGVFIADYALRRGRYDGAGLHGGRDGIYWRRGGFHPAAFIALAAGIAVALLTIDTTVYVGPLSQAMGGADISIPAGFAVSAALYWLLARSGVRAETAGAPTVSPAAVLAPGPAGSADGPG
jgi:nucleobase:cation symporter-1, NCS1 family